MDVEKPCSRLCNRDVEMKMLARSHSPVGGMGDAGVGGWAMCFLIWAVIGEAQRRELLPQLEGSARAKTYFSSFLRNKWTTATWMGEEANGPNKPQAQKCQALRRLRLCQDSRQFCVARVQGTMRRRGEGEAGRLGGARSQSH